MLPILKKFAALMLSLLISLSLLPSQVHATDLPEPEDPPAQVETLEPESPHDPEDEAAPASAGGFPRDEHEEGDGDGQ